MVSVMRASLLAAVMAPPMYMGCVTTAEAMNMLRVSVSKAFTMRCPLWLMASPTAVPMLPSSLPMFCACSGVSTPSWASLVSSVDMSLLRLVLRLLPSPDRVPFCSLLSSDISLLVNTYPPITLSLGRYCVLAAFTA